MLQNLKMLGLLTAQTEFILGEKRKFSKREFPLSEVLEITEAITSESIKKAGVKLKIPKTSMEVKGDRDVIMGGLEHIILRLIPITKSIKIEADTKKKKLILHYEADQMISLNKLPLIETLRKGGDAMDIFFEINVHLMNKSGVKTSFKKGLIELKF